MIFMEQIMINFHMDEDLKKSMEVDPFYTESNMKHLEQVIA